MLVAEVAWKPMIKYTLHRLSSTYLVSVFIMKIGFRNSSKVSFHAHTGPLYYFQQAVLYLHIEIDHVMLNERESDNFAAGNLIARNSCYIAFIFRQIEIKKTTFYSPNILF